MDNSCMHSHRDRRGGTLMIVLLIMVSVAFLTTQGVRLMMLTGQAYEQRVTATQASELLELARLRLADKQQTESLSVEVPRMNGMSARVGKIEIEKKTNTDDGWRIIVRYPHNQSNELTVTWESPS